MLSGISTTVNHAKEKPNTRKQKVQQNSLRQLEIRELGGTTVFCLTCTASRQILVHYIIHMYEAR